MVNNRPVYVAIPQYSLQQKKYIPNRFDIWKHKGLDMTRICSMDNRGDRLNNILKRGIPLDDAKILFYQMD